MVLYSQGGRSSRFGSNKALFAPDGETLINKAVDLLRPLVKEVVVSASHANAGAYAFLGLDIVEDQHSDCGPLGGLEALLDRCSTRWLLILTCDMPCVDSDMLRRMIDHVKQSRSALRIEISRRLSPGDAATEVSPPFLCLSRRTRYQSCAVA